MINYFKVMNLFWDAAPYLDGYKTDHPALFHAVVDSINRNGWRETEIEYDRIINKVRLGKKNYLEARKWLVLHQFITLKPGMGDYAKAKFGLGNAVLGRTAPGTAPDTAPATPSDTIPAPFSDDAVPASTPSETAYNTAPSANAVLPSTAPDTAGNTASDTAPGTASHTYLIKELITTNELLKTVNNNVDNDAADDEVNSDAVTSSQKNERQPAADEGDPHPPSPLPTADDVRQTLLNSGPHIRQAIERHKLAKTPNDFADLVEEFIDQQLGRVDDGQPPFKKMSDTRSHFMSWLNKKKEVKDANQTRTHGTTAINQPTGQRPKAVGPTPPATGQQFGTHWGGNRFRKPGDVN